MSRQTIVCVCAATLFSALTVTAATSPAKAEGLVVSAFRETPPSAAVAYADLNLESAEGRQHLDRRVRVAIRQICGEPAMLPLRQRGAQRHCAAVAWQNAEPQIAAAIQRDRFAGRSAPILVAAR